MFELRRSGVRNENPLAVYDKEEPIKNGDLAVDRGSLKGMASMTVAADEVFCLCPTLAQKYVCREAP